MEENKEYLAPDYSDHPREDDDEDILEEISEDDAKIEKILDEQAEYNNALDRHIENNNLYINNNIMGSSFNSGSSPWNTGSSSKAPWEQNQQDNSNSRWGGGSWGSSNNGASSWNNGSSWNNSGSNWNQQNRQETKTVDNNSSGSCNKKVVVCDVLDCLYESWESNGRPNLLPRGIFDLKPKFEVWDKIASFAPRKLYIIFPAPEIIPSFGNRRSAEVTLEYVAQSISTYVRIPRVNCVILKQMQEGTPKEKTLIGAIKDWKNPNDIVYIGIHSGRYGLSSRDKDAAHLCGIDYVDMYNLLAGRYDFE